MKKKILAALLAAMLLLLASCKGDTTVNYRTDKTAAEVVDLYIRQLADALSGYINFIEPEVLLLGGGISLQGDALLVPLRELVSKQVYDRYADRQTVIRTATLGNDAGIIGAAFLNMAAYIE